jgi:hypothetical protein
MQVHQGLAQLRGSLNLVHALSGDTIPFMTDSVMGIMARW